MTRRGVYPCCGAPAVLHRDDDRNRRAWIRLCPGAGCRARWKVYPEPGGRLRFDRIPPVGTLVPFGKDSALRAGA